MGALRHGPGADGHSSGEEGPVQQHQLALLVWSGYVGVWVLGVGVLGSYVDPIWLE